MREEPVRADDGVALEEGGRLAGELGPVEEGVGRVGGGCEEEDGEGCWPDRWVREAEDGCDAVHFVRFLWLCFGYGYSGWRWGGFRCWVRASGRRRGKVRWDRGCIW